MTLNPRDALAVKYFPGEWAAVATKSGASKSRQRLRQRAETQVVIEGLRNNGSSCGGCQSFRVGDSPAQPKNYCATHSDFHGYAVTKPSDVCTLWTAAKPTP